MNLGELNSSIQKLNTYLTDMEWRIFKEWDSVIPDEIFYAYKYESILKRAVKEKISIKNLKQYESNTK